MSRFHYHAAPGHDTTLFADHNRTSKTVPLDENQSPSADILQPHPEVQPTQIIRRPPGLPRSLRDPVTITAPVPPLACSSRSPQATMDGRTTPGHPSKSRPPSSWSCYTLSAPVRPQVEEQSDRTAASHYNAFSWKNDHVNSNPAECTPQERESNVSYSMPQHWGSGNKGFKFPTLEDPFIDHSATPGTIQRKRRVQRNTLEDTGNLGSPSRVTGRHPTDHNISILTVDWPTDGEKMLSLDSETQSSRSSESNSEPSISNDHTTHWRGSSAAHGIYRQAAAKRCGSHIRSTPFRCPTPIRARTEECAQQDAWPPASSTRTFWDHNVEYPESRHVVGEQCDAEYLQRSDLEAMDSSSTSSQSQARRMLRMRKEMVDLHASCYRHGKEVEELAAATEELRKGCVSIVHLEVNAVKNEKNIRKLEKKVREMDMRREEDQAAEKEDRYWPGEQGQDENRQTGLKLSTLVALPLWVLLLGALTCFLLGMDLASRPVR